MLAQRSRVRMMEKYKRDIELAATALAKNKGLTGERYDEFVSGYVWGAERAYELGQKTADAFSAYPRWGRQERQWIPALVNDLSLLAGTELPSDPQFMKNHVLKYWLDECHRSLSENPDEQV